MKKSKLGDSHALDIHIAQLSENIQSAIKYLRQVMLSIDNNIAEHIKWNSPAFYYSGVMQAFNPKQYKRDILVVNLRKGSLLCILPTGMKIKKNTRLLEGRYTDGRRIINFQNLEDIKEKEAEFMETIKEWLRLLDE